MDTKTPRIDLHGVKHADVRQEVIRFVEKYWNTNTRIQIVTGNSPAMKKEVINVLKEYKLDYVIGDFFGFVSNYITTKV
jgi:DNA-nicking Smr family endonuclease